MEDNEQVGDYFTRILGLVNQMCACGDTITNLAMIEKVMRTLTPKFDYIMVAIEESKDLTTM